MHIISGLGSMHLLLGYIVFNIDPIFLHLGPISVHWYGLGYVVAIVVALWYLMRWARHEGINEDQIWGVFIWTAIAALVGARLYYVIQQPNLIQNFILHPINIIAVWNGGMAFFGAVFLGIATLFILAPRYGLSRWIAIDAGAVFAMIGQIFGRFGNLINGDITGQALTNGPITIPGDICAHAPCIAYVADKHILPWAIVYLNPGSFAVRGIPFQPAPVYEMIANLVALAILWNLRYRLPARLPGAFFTVYLALYATGQFFVFFLRGSEPYTPFLGIDVLKQAQWTAIFTLLLSVVLYAIVTRFSRPWPYSEQNPAPWPPEGSGIAAPTMVTITPAVSVAAGALSGAGAAAAVPARATFAATTATTTPTGRKTEAPPAPRAAAEPTQSALVELPPWQPYHATRGELRNVFAGRDS